MLHNAQSIICAEPIKSAKKNYLRFVRVYAIPIPHIPEEEYSSCMEPNSVIRSITSIAKIGYKFVI